MSNFLNNFSDENYDQDETAIAQEESVDKGLEEIEESSENVQVFRKLKGKAFDQEKVTYDDTYHQFKYKKTAVICSTIVILSAMFIGLFLYLNQTLSITLVGKTEDEAITWLEKNKVSYDKVSEENKTIPTGVVISQEIPAGEKITRSDLQIITVSTGPNMKEVLKLSDLKGKSKTEIEEFIEKNTLPNSKLSYEYSDEIKENKLIRIEFENETVDSKNYTRSEQVNFIISKGSKSDSKNKKVDNFVNQTIDSVAEWNADAGIIIDEVPIASNIPEGYIISQSVAPGEMLGFGDVLTLEVSKGSGIAMPNVVGYSEQGASEELTKNNIMFEVVEQYSDSDYGYIISQSIPASTPYFEEDSGVILTKSLGSPFIDDVSGGSLKDAVDMINALNEQGANISYYTEEVTRSEEEKEEGISAGTVKSISSNNKYVSIGSTVKITLYK